MSQSINFTLPWPPSVNSYWRTVLLPVGKGGKARGKFAPRVLLSEDGRAYRMACAVAIASQKVPRGALTGKLRIELVAHVPDNRARDIDNLLKGSLDALHHCGVIRDDSDIDDLHIRRGSKRPGGALVVEIAEIEGEATMSGELFAESA